VKFEEHIPPEYEKYKFDVKNMKFARAKIRKELKITDQREEILDWTGWVPDRSARVEPVDDDWILTKMKIGKQFYKHPVEIGRTAYTRKELVISAHNLQGISIIVGKKGTGKSHLAKALLLGLIDNGAIGLIFDINDEYSALKFNLDGTESKYSNKIITLDPGVNLRFTLPYIGADVFFDVIQTTMGLPEASAYELRNIWDDLEEKGPLSFSKLRKEVENTLDRRILGAIIRRLDRMEQTGLFTDNPEESIKFEEEFKRIKGGGAIVINLRLKSKDTIDLVVQTVLSKLREILEKRGQPIFIFAEEAHFYLEKTDWADAVTRMRHLGTYQIYMTNTPTEILPLVIRQTDNLFLFHLTEESDLKHISPAAKIDPETVIQIAKALPARRCLTVGEVTNHYPFVIDVTALNVRAAGATRKFFEDL
jgi:DNA helicase HerA-like ATPase